VSKTVKLADELFSEQTLGNEYNNVDICNSFTLICQLALRHVQHKQNTLSCTSAKAFQSEGFKLWNYVTCNINRILFLVLPQRHSKVKALNSEKAVWKPEMLKYIPM